MTDLEYRLYVIIFCWGISYPKAHPPPPFVTWSWQPYSSDFDGEAWKAEILVWSNKLKWPCLKSVCKLAGSISSLASKGCCDGSNKYPFSSMQTNWGKSQSSELCYKFQFSCQMTCKMSLEDINFGWTVPRNQFNNVPWKPSSFSHPNLGNPGVTHLRQALFSVLLWIL